MQSTYPAICISVVFAIIAFSTSVHCSSLECDAGALSPDGKRLAVAVSKGRGEKTVTAIAEFNLSKNSLKKLAEFRGSFVKSLRYSPDNDVLFLEVRHIRQGKGVKLSFAVIDVRGPGIINRFDVPDIVSDIKGFDVGRGGNLYAVTHVPGTKMLAIETWSQTGEKRGEIARLQPEPKRSSPRELQYVPAPGKRGTLIARIGSEFLSYSLNDTGHAHSLGEIDRTWDFFVSRNAGMLALYSRICRAICPLREKSEETCLVFKKLPGLETAGRHTVPHGISDGALTADGKLFAGIQGLKESEDSTLFEPQYEVDGTGRIFVFDTLSGGLSDSLETGHTDELISLYFSGDSRRLIALDKAGRLHLWDLPDTKRKEFMPDWQQLFEEGGLQKTEGQPAKKSTR